MLNKSPRVALSVSIIFASMAIPSAVIAQDKPADTAATDKMSANEKAVPAPTVDTNKDGKADAWDRDANGVPDAWDVNGDGQPDQVDDNGDGKPDDQVAPAPAAEPESPPR
jgi:hypothetical protein